MQSAVARTCPCAACSRALSRQIQSDRDRSLCTESRVACRAVCQPRFHAVRCGPHAGPPLPHRSPYIPPAQATDRAAPAVRAAAGGSVYCGPHDPSATCSSSYLRSLDFARSSAFPGAGSICTAACSRIRGHRAPIRQHTCADACCSTAGASRDVSQASCTCMSVDPHGCGCA